MGGGCIASGASDALVAFSEKLNAPVTASTMGLGCFPASHPNYLGLIGMHGMSNVAEAMQDANGYLPSDATPDGVHLTPDYCKIWMDYLKTHTA